MHKVDVPLYDDDKCEAALRRALERENNLQRPSQLRLHPSEICAGGETGNDELEFTCHLRRSRFTDSCDLMWLG